MAVTGVFAADFGSFFDAVDKSEIKLKELETGANKVSDNLSRMANSFSGNKIIQDATLMAKVFEDAGGASAFTEKELARMAATATEAAEKLTALGKDVPEGIRKIAAETKEASKETESWTASWKQMAIGFVSMQTVMAGWNFVKDVVEQAGALQDLSEQTKINVEDLQIMGAAMRDFGINTDELGRALFKLSARIASGDDSVKNALLDLGLAYENVRNMKGEELFRTVMDAAGKMNNALSDTSLITLFGEKLAMSMSGAAKGTAEALDKARSYADFMSKENIEAMDRAGESVDRFTAKLATMVSKIVGPVASGLNDFLAVAEKADFSQAGWARTKDAFIELLGKEKHYFDDLAASVGVETTAKIQEREATEKAAGAGHEQVAVIDAQTAALQRKRQEEAAAGLKEFEEITRVAAKKQEVIDEQYLTEQAAANARAENSAREIREYDSKIAAGRSFMAAVNEQAKATKDAADAAAGYMDEQTAMTAANDALWQSVETVADAHEDAGAAAEAAGQQTVAAYTGIQQQVELTSDGVRGWLMLMAATNRANAILNENSLFTSTGQLNRVADVLSGGGLGGTVGAFTPSFAGGVENFGGGLAKVHGGELLVNLPRGTSVIPKGAGGTTVSNTFNLTDTESNLARRVAESIMRTIRAGTQLGTA